jgi:molybdopterin molybdotransferase
MASASPMTPFAEALKLILGALPKEQLATQTVPLADALGYTLGADMAATRNQPPFDASAMDGYACHHADLPGQLTLVGEAAAGRPFIGPVSRGTCVRISTGAPVPEGANCVIMQEAVQIVSDAIALPLVTPCQNIRRAGNDFCAGATRLKRGHRLNARDIGMLAAIGVAQVPVFEPPKVSIISGGDEIVTVGAELNAGQIYDSAGPGVAALAATWGGKIAEQIVVADSKLSLVGAIKAASAKSDLIVIIGGASVGPHDHARPSIQALNGEILVSGIAIKPGKPTWFARTDGGFILGLPGNPAAAMVCARLFLVPLLQVMLARGDGPNFTTHRACLAQALPPTNGRTEAFRVAFDKASATVTAFSDQDSSLVSVLSSSDGLVICDPNTPSLPAGTYVELVLWDT